MQLAKTTNAVERFRREGLSYISVLTDPTTGGVSASFAFQADIIVAEAGAAIGFAGRRVIEQTIRQKLPENFQRAEFLLEHGAIDMVVDRPKLRETLVRLLDYGIARSARREPQRRAAGRRVVNPIVDREKGLLELERRITELKGLSSSQNVDLSGQIAALEAEYAKIQRDIFGALSPWERVNMARHPKRPTSAEYIAKLDQFDELHGDRHFRDDPAVIAGFAKLRSRRVMVDRSATRTRHERESSGQLRDGEARGLSQDQAALRAGVAPRDYRSSRSSIRRAPIRVLIRKNVRNRKPSPPVCMRSPNRSFRRSRS